VRVLFLTHRLPFAPNRGDRIRAFHLLRMLSRSAEVHLVALAHDADEWSHRGDLDAMTASTDVVRVNRGRNLLAATAALAGTRPLTHVLLHAPEIYAVLERCLARTRPDVVLAYCSGMARYACEPILSGIPFVLDLVDVDSEKWRALALSSEWPKRWVFRREADCLLRFEVGAIRRAAATSVVSERERVVLGQVTGGLDAAVVPNGIDLQAFAPPSPPAEAPHVVFCGVFSYEPNERAAIWFARSVWPTVVRERPEARLFLVGMDPPRAVRALAHDATIEVTGKVPEVREYLWRSAVAVAPLDIARGLQNKVLEAIAAGLPTVVTTAVADGLPVNVRSACAVADTAGAFAAEVIALLAASPRARRDIAARADLGHLTWERQLEPMLQLLERASTRGGR
jgi:sugar transferase (PEP-CTERM/EpsH1 system associated)